MRLTSRQLAALVRARRGEVVWPLEEEEQIEYIARMRREHSLAVASLRNESPGQNMRKHVSTGMLTPGLPDTFLPEMARRPEGADCIVSYRRRVVDGVEYWGTSRLGFYVSLYIEMKRQRGYYGKTPAPWTGSIRASQMEWIDRLRAKGSFAVVAFGAVEAFTIATRYLAGGLALPNGYYYPKEWFDGS